MLRASVRRTCVRAEPRPRPLLCRPFAIASPSPSPRESEQPHSAPIRPEAIRRSSAVLETLLDKRKPLKAPPEITEPKPAAPEPAYTDTILSDVWEQQEVELLRIFDQMMADNKRARDAHRELQRMRDMIHKTPQPNTQLKWHLTRVGPHPGLADYFAISAPLSPAVASAAANLLHSPPQSTATGEPSSKPAAFAKSSSAPQKPNQSSATHSTPPSQRGPTQAPLAWDSASDDDSSKAQSEPPIARVRHLLTLVRSDVENLFTYVTASKLRRMLSIESAHLSWIRFLLAILALLLIVPEDSNVAPSAENQRMLRLLLLALLLMHTQQLLLRFSSLNMQRRPQYFFSMASGVSFAVLWLMAVLLLPSAKPKPSSSPPSPSPASNPAAAPNTAAVTPSSTPTDTPAVPTPLAAHSPTLAAAASPR